MRVRKLLSIFALTSALTGCVAPPPAQVSKAEAENPAAATALPALQSFSGSAAVAALRSNAEMERDYLDLVFRMESGRTLPTLTRFSGPITIAMRGNVPGTAPTELARVVNRFRNEAGLDVSIVPNPEQASIVIDFRPKNEMRRAVPTAACFVVPGVKSFDEYQHSRGTVKVDWSRVQKRERAAIFVPSDTNPQEVRDCLHEELAQAMGPLNDLYRLSDSVFNDDNFQSVLTGFDMLMLRVHYSPELANGMNEAEVAQRLPGILNRLNPKGARAGELRQMSPRSWIGATEASFAGGRAHPEAAQRMLSIAMAQGWHDGRLAFSHFALARALSSSDPAASVQHYVRAQAIWRGLPGGAIHAAHVDMQLAAIALSSGESAKALALTERAIPVARQFQNASLLATLLGMQAEAYEATGRVTEARAARLDSLGWARYAFGSEAQVRARMNDIAALGSRGRRG